MLTKPFSVRFSKTMTNFIQSIADMGQKTPSDFIREAVEEKAFSEGGYRSQLVPLLMAPKDTLNQIFEKLDRNNKGILHEALSLPELSALMIFWHQAYQTGSNYANYANPEYVITILNITKDLFIEAKRQKIKLDFDFCHSRLGFSSEVDDYEQYFCDLNTRFQKNATVTWAETLASPLANMANYLGLYTHASLRPIFTSSRLEKLLPVAVKGSGAAQTDIVISLDLRQLLPHMVKFEVGGMIYMLCSEPFSMVVEGNHHCYAFQAESLLSLILFSENDYALSQDTFGAGLRRKTVEVQRDLGKAIIHEHGGYRLVMSESDFMELRKYIRETFQDQRWSWLLKRYRNLKGDI